eukprot:2652652-Prymnesium_polylepis.1
MATAVDAAHVLVCQARDDLAAQQPTRRRQLSEESAEPVLKESAVLLCRISGDALVVRGGSIWQANH